MTISRTQGGISIVIPTMNRREVLIDTLRDLRAQSFHDYEVIVVDQSDTPNSEAEALLKTFEVPTRYFHVTHFRGLPEARNYGWRSAQNGIVLYIDDDIRCENTFLQEHFDAHKSSGAAMVAGGITEAKGDRTQSGGTGSFNWWTATPRRNYHLQTDGWCLHAPGGNFSIRKKIIEEVGGFDENLTVGAALYEETEFGLRLRSAGYRCWFAPKAHLLHLAAPMGGCRVGPSVERYVFGMAHNRAILIFRHLRLWHRPSALARMLLFGISY
jgi:GT2 family glycosyltransferase